MLPDSVQIPRWTAAKRIFRYLQGTKSYGLENSKGDDDGSLVRFSDTDWDGESNNQKSTSGYVFLMNGGAISWKSRKQTCVILSTAEAEYVALASAAKDTVWMRQLLSDLHHQQHGPTVIIKTTRQPFPFLRTRQSHTKMKHIDIRYHYI